MTATTGQVLTDVLIFLAFFGVSLAGVWIDATRRVRRGKWTR